jgi:hypothetical protein
MLLRIWTGLGIALAIYRSFYRTAKNSKSVSPPVHHGKKGLKSRKLYHHRRPAPQSPTMLSPYTTPTALPRDTSTTAPLLLVAGLSTTERKDREPEGDWGREGSSSWGSDMARARWSTVVISATADVVLRCPE